VALRARRQSIWESIRLTYGDREKTAIDQFISKEKEDQATKTQDIEKKRKIAKKNFAERAREKAR